MPILTRILPKLKHTLLTYFPASGPLNSSSEPRQASKKPAVDYYDSGTPKDDMQVCHWGQKFEDAFTGNAGTHAGK
jgi:hypothetical protein